LPVEPDQVGVVAQPVPVQAAAPLSHAR
jgi:hypothetical protein